MYGKARKQRAAATNQRSGEPFGKLITLHKLRLVVTTYLEKNHKQQLMRLNPIHCEYRSVIFIGHC